MPKESKELKKELISYISVYYDKKNLKEQNEMADEILKVFNTNKEFRNKVEKMAKKINDDKKIKKGGRRKTRKYQKGGNWIFFIVIALLICYGIYVVTQNRAANERAATSSERIEQGLQDDREQKDAGQQMNTLVVPDSPPRTFGGDEVGPASSSPAIPRTNDSRERIEREASLRRRVARARTTGTGNILGGIQLTSSSPNTRRRAQSKSADARAQQRLAFDNEESSSNNNNSSSRQRRTRAKSKTRVPKKDKKEPGDKKDQGGGRKRRKTRKKQKRRK